MTTPRLRVRTEFRQHFTVDVVGVGGAVDRTVSISCTDAEVRRRLIELVTNDAYARYRPTPDGAA